MKIDPVGETGVASGVGRRRIVDPQQVPISVSVLSGADLDRSSVDGVAEALASVPGAATTESYIGAGTNIIIRGVGASFPLFTGPSAVSYYLDDVPFGLVKSAVGPDANVYDLERVEVLRGPQGTLYGASALNGVVRVLTSDPDLGSFDIKGRASLSATEHGDPSGRGDLAVNIPVAPGRFALRASASYQDNGGWIDQLDRRDANASTIQSYRLKAMGRLTDQLTIGASAWLSRASADAPDFGYTWDESESSLSQPTRTDYDALGFKIEYDGDAVSIMGSTSYLRYLNEGSLGLDVTGFGIPDSIFFSQLKSKIFTQEINLNSTGAGPWRWSVGGIYRDGTEDLFQSFTVIPVPEVRYFNTSKSFAIYGELTRLFFDDQVEVTGGLRYFHDRIGQRGQNAPGQPFLVSRSKADATTPRAVINWRPNAQTTLYLSYSQGFRSGFPQTAGVLAAIPNFPAVQPDRLTNYEAGAKLSLLDNSLTLDASIYHIDWRDIQLLLAISINGLPYPGVVNGARARGEGIDLALTYRPTSRFTRSPYVSVNTLKVSDDVLSGGQIFYARGDRPSGSPRLTAGVAIDYVFDLGRLPMRLSGALNYVSSLSYRSLNGTDLLVQSSDGIVSSRVSIAVDVTDVLTLSLFGSNLTGERGAAAIMFPGVAPNWDARVRPRTVGLQLEYRHR